MVGRQLARVQALSIRGSGDERDLLSGLLDRGTQVANNATDVSETGMRMKRIVIYGGTDLDESAISMVKHVVRALLQYPDTVIVTGGIIQVKDKPSVM